MNNDPNWKDASTTNPTTNLATNAYVQNPIIVIILIGNWLIYLVNLQTHSQLIKPLVLILIQGELKSVFLILLVALSLTSLIISYSNIIFTSMLILHNLIWIL